MLGCFFEEKRGSVLLNGTFSAQIDLLGKQVLYVQTLESKEGESLENGCVS